MQNLFNSVVNTVKSWFTPQNAPQVTGYVSDPLTQQAENLHQSTIQDLRNIKQQAAQNNATNNQFTSMQSKLDPYITQANKNAQLINWGYNYNNALAGASPDTTNNSNPTQSVTSTNQTNQANDFAQKQKLLLRRQQDMTDALSWLDWFRRVHGISPMALPYS